MYYVLCPLTTLVVCQIVKFIIEFIKLKKINIKRIFYASGGMPSSHTALTTSLMMIILLKDGIENPYFAISLVLMSITAYDAMGIRKESGRHAVILNELLKRDDKLKEEIGHEPLEVVVGGILGIIVAILYNIT